MIETCIEFPCPDCGKPIEPVYRAENFGPGLCEDCYVAENHHCWVDLTNPAHSRLTRLAALKEYATDYEREKMIAEHAMDNKRVDNSRNRK